MPTGPIFVSRAAAGANVRVIVRGSRARDGAEQSQEASPWVAAATSRGAPARDDTPGCTLEQREHVRVSASSTWWMGWTSRARYARHIAIALDTARDTRRRQWKPTRIRWPSCNAPLPAICRRSECQAMEREKNHGNAPRVRALFLLNQAAPGAAPVKATSASSSRRSRPNGAREQAESRTREAHSHGPITAPDKCQRQAEMASERAVAPTSKNTNGPALLSCVCGCLLTGAIIGLVCSRVPSAECERCAQWIPDTIEPGTRVVGGVLGPDTIHREAGNRRETPT